MPNKLRHFLSLNDCSSDELAAMMARAMEMKSEGVGGRSSQVLAGKVLVMIFEKSSTRTRVSFEVAMRQLGGHAIFLSASDTQIGRGEPPQDSARVLSTMCDAVMFRASSHDSLVEFSDYATVPVINGLTEKSHPCQLLADMLTWHECHNTVRGRTAAWIGDGNNMCNSYIHAASLFGFNLRIACPNGYAPDADALAAAKDSVALVSDPLEAATGADLVVADVWSSMGQEAEVKERRAAFKGYQVNAEVMRRANADAIFMHCLPAHRDEEVSTEVLEGAQSVVWQEAANRVHAQKALLEMLLR